jgi:hypothetical protein
MSMAMVLRKIAPDATVHGFRSTTFSSEVVEMALAHAIGNRTEAAYRRGDLFNKRSVLMDAWGRFCTAPDGATNVTPIREHVR